jgi:hypothetical protein
MVCCDRNGKFKKMPYQQIECRKTDLFNNASQGYIFLLSNIVLLPAMNTGNPKYSTKIKSHRQSRDDMCCVTEDKVRNSGGIV